MAKELTKKEKEERLTPLLGKEMPNKEAAKIILKDVMEDTRSLEEIQKEYGILDNAWD